MTQPSLADAHCITQSLNLKGSQTRVGHARLSSTQTFVNIVVNLDPKGNFRQFKSRKCYFCGEGPNGFIESSLWN